MNSHDWMDNARCAGADVETFFPEPGNVEGGAALTQYVKDTYCNRCPVLDSCLQDAIDTEPTRHDRVGIRGGLTANERNELVKALTKRNESRAPRAEKAVCGTVGGHSKHRRDGTPICDPCRAADTARMREYRAARQAVSA